MYLIDYQITVLYVPVQRFCGDEASEAFIFYTGERGILCAFVADVRKYDHSSSFNDLIIISNK